MPIRLSLLVAVIVLLGVGALAGEAAASHFRHGNLNWKKASGAPAGSQRITIQYEQSWRRDAFGTPPAQGDIINTGETCIDWGDDTPQQCLDAVVEFVNEAENYMRIQALAPGSTTNINVPHDYANPNGTFQLLSTSCCTIGELNNAAGMTWNILSRVNLAGDDESAVSTIPAIVTVPSGGIQSFTVPANDAGGERRVFRLSTAQESCVGCADPHPPDISINSNTGRVTLDTTGLDGLNWTGVVIESRNAQGQTVATSHIQYIIRVGGTQTQPPVWDPPTPPDSTVFTVTPGQSVDFRLQASDPDAEDTVSILQNSGPGTFTSTDGNPATGAFSFTAQSSDVGNDYIVQFIAQDEDGAGPPFRSYTISVRSQQGTEGTPGAPTCSDLQDNDSDGLTDNADPDCQTPGDGTAPDTPITSGPPAFGPDNTATFTFSSSHTGATFECSLDGGPFVPCSSPFTTPSLPPGRHTFAVRAISVEGIVDPTPTVYTWRIAAELSDLPLPVLGEEFNVGLVPGSGPIFFAVPRSGSTASASAGASQKGLRFRPLRQARQLPMGSFLKTRQGTVELVSATGSTTPGERTQSGKFGGGVFQVLQSRARRARGLTELRLKGSSFDRCRTGASGRAGAAQVRRRSIRRLRSNTRGRFSARGRYSAGTTRGTVWITADRCDGTLTTVKRGKVAVRDFRRKKTVLVKAGKSYLAKAPR
jgi:hypothetical protein